MSDNHNQGNQQGNQQDPQKRNMNEDEGTDSAEMGTN
jgi:hypothetical protein